MGDQTKPGLEPRQLTGDVQINVDSDRLPADSSPSEQPSVTDSTPVQAADNTPATTQDAESNVALTQDTQPVAEQPQYTDRANERIQSLVAERAQAQAEATQYKTMLQNLVNAQAVKPTLSEEEVLAKQYQSFDAKLGYPTDPREYAAFNQQQAIVAATKAAQAANEQIQERNELSELARLHPDVGQDPTLYGAMIAERQTAAQKGVHLSYAQAADIATQKLDKRAQQRLKQQEAQDIQNKNEAYVETSRGASSSRSSNAIPEFKDLGEMERWLKENNSW